MPNREALKDELIRTDAEFRALFEEHQESDRKLQQLLQKSIPEPEDEVEEKRLKVHKLALKDRMEVMLRARLEAQVSA
jgi:uncharacterized protein YdcH (DUF465 family)